MIRFWTERARRLQEALESSFFLRAAFTAYSFITLLFFAPAPALGSPSLIEMAQGVEIECCFTQLLPGGDPAALESGDLDLHPWGAFGSHDSQCLTAR